MISVIRSIVLLLYLVIHIKSVNANEESLIMTSPPRESAADGALLYGPLAKNLSALIGREIVYRHPGNWMKYQRDMKRNEFDIVFDGPHFASWRIKYYDHVPVAKLPGTLIFYLVTPAKNININKAKDLAAKKVCVIPPPNLSALVLLSKTDGPAREPVLVTIKGGMEEVFASLEKQQCEAAVLSTTFYNKALSDLQRSQLKIVYTSDELPNQVITVSNRLTAEQQQKIADYLTHDESVATTQKILESFGNKQAKSFIPVKPGEYTGYSELLEGVILGWRKNKKDLAPISLAPRTDQSNTIQPD